MARFGSFTSSTDVGGVGAPRGYIDGLVISSAVDTDHDITIAAGIAKDSTNTYDLQLSGITKQIDATWAAGDNAGGLFTGVVANNTWYHMFVIRKDSDGTIDAGFDTSISAANIPAGYTAYRRIGSVRSDGAANIIAFKAYEAGRTCIFEWVTPALDFDGTIGDADQPITLRVPPGIKCAVDLRVSALHGTQLAVVAIRSPGMADQTPSVSAAPLSDVRVNVVSIENLLQVHAVCTEADSVVAARSNQASTTLRVAVIRYWDTR